MLFQHMPTSCDLSETSVVDAAVRLGMKNYHDQVLYCSRSDAPRARRIQAVLGCEVVVIPDALLPSRTAWAIEWNGQLLGSPGAL